MGIELMFILVFGLGFASGYEARDGENDDRVHVVDDWGSDSCHDRKPRRDR